MAALTNSQRAFIVRHLAMWETPTEVAEAFDEEYGIEINPSQVSYYDPTTASKRDDLADRWVELHDETRERYRERVMEKAIANKVFRVAELQEFFRTAKRQGNIRLAADFLKQAAREVGGSFENVRILEHSGRGGGPIQSIDMSELSDEQVHRLAAGEDPADVLGGE